MEQIYLLDNKTAPVFGRLHPLAPEIWFREGSIALGTVADRKAAALLTATVLERTVWLDWLYVAEEFRGSGIGSRLLDRFLKNLEGYGGDSLIHVTCEEEMKRYLENRGFTFDTAPGYTTFTAPLNEVKELPAPKESDRIRPLYALSGSEVNQINDLLTKDPRTSVGIALPVDASRYMGESAVYIHNGIRAMLFLELAGERINLSYAWCASQNDGAALLKLFAQAKRSVEDRFWEEMEITATSLNEQSKALIKKLMPTARSAELWEGNIFLI